MYSKRRGKGKKHRHASVGKAHVAKDYEHRGDAAKRGQDAGDGGHGVARVADKGLSSGKPRTVIKRKRMAFKY